MADGATAGSGDTALTERYEQLRRVMLDGDAEGWRLGLGLLVTRGMAAWMRAWTDCPPPPRAVAAATEAPPSHRAVAVVTEASSPFGPQAGELVAVLAQMALAHT